MGGYSLNATEFGDWLVVPADDDHVTILDLTEIPGEVSLGLLNVDFDHGFGFQSSRDQTRSLV
jgi:hypothetical protein